MENNHIARSFVKTLVYFDVFSHPLLPEEVIEYCSYPDLDIDEGLKVLEELKDGGLINYQAGFYYLGNDTSKVTRRLDENRLAEQRMRTAERYSRLISNFPFIRAVFISGTLSKNVMKPDSDIDFFIITQPGRLWVCRAMLTFYKKFFLLNSHRNFCLNYFVDTNSLEIPEKNLYTSTEIAFILPMYNYQLYREFISANNWYREDYPNLGIHQGDKGIRPSKLKKIFEYVLNNGIGDMLDQLSFSIILKYWRRKFNYMDEKSFSVNLKSQKNVSRHHPNDFQEPVLKLYAEKIRLFEQSTGFYLSDPVVKQYT